MILIKSSKVQVKKVSKSKGKYNAVFDKNLRTPKLKFEKRQPHGNFNKKLK